MKKWIFFTIICFGPLWIWGQNILLDKPVQAGELTLFPDMSNPNQYYFLPNKLRLGLNANGKPQFSFLRFVQNIKTGEGEEALREGEGGGVVHAVVELYVSDEQKNDAARELKRVTKNSEAIMIGPVIYKSGTMSLVSSIANEKGGYAKSVIGLGPAPLLVGNKAAVSVLLTKDGSKILWESFNTPTPDMSFSFVMSVGGYHSPINVKIECDYANIYNSTTLDIGLKYGGGGSSGKEGSKSTGSQGSSSGSGFFLDAELKLAFEEMRKTGVIKVTGATGDQNMEKIVEIAYSKLLDQMFEKVDNAGTSPQDMNALLQSINQKNGQNPGGQQNNGKQANGLSIVYQMKKIKKSGTFVVDLNRSLSDELQFRFDENVGQNFSKLQCPECFRQVNLDDPLFRQREIQVSVDGLNADQFKKYVNFATISLKKLHGNDDITTDEVRVGVEDFDKKGNVFRLLYGWKDEMDADKNRWLKYDYKVNWSLFGDYTVEGEWKTSEAFGINVAPPVRPVLIELEGSADLLRAANVRSAIVKFYYDYGGGEKVEQAVIRTDAPVTAAKVELLLPQNQYAYEYEIIWRLSGNKEVRSKRQPSDNTLIYIDELPEN